MSLAERTREAARSHPFLIDALGADVVNYTAAARFLDVEGEVDAVATALRRYAADLSPPGEDGGSATVSMERGLVRTDDETATDAEPSVLSVSGERFAPGDGSLTGISARGDLEPTALATVLGRLAAADVPVEAAGASEVGLTVVVGRRYGADALRVVEDELSA